MPIVQQPGPLAGAALDPTRGPAASGLAALIVAHQAMVWRYLRMLGADPDEADDLMQDTFLRAAEGVQRGEELLAPAAFLRAVARNLLIGARRRARRRPPNVEWIEAVDSLVAKQPDAFDDRRIVALSHCVERLQGRMRQAVEWHHIDGQPCQAMAQRLGIGLQGVKSLLSRAREILRQCIEQRIQESSS